MLLFVPLAVLAARFCITTSYLGGMALHTIMIFSQTMARGKRSSRPDQTSTEDQFASFLTAMRAWDFGWMLEAEEPVVEDGGGCKIFIDGI